MDDTLLQSYTDIFSLLRTKKKFVFKEVNAKGQVVIEREDEICGQRENRPYVFDTPAELQKFVAETNKEEIEYQRRLTGNEMPYR